MEIDALAGAVAEMGRLTGVPCPTIDTVLALVRQRARLAEAGDALSIVTQKITQHLRIVAPVNRGAADIGGRGCRQPVA